MTHLLFTIHRRDGHLLANENIVTLAASADTLHFARQLLSPMSEEQTSLIAFCMNNGEQVTAPTQTLR